MAQAPGAMPDARPDSVPPASQALRVRRLTAAHCRWKHVQIGVQAHSLLLHSPIVVLQVEHEHIFVLADFSLWQCALLVLATH